MVTLAAVAAPPAAAEPANAVDIDALVQGHLPLVQHVVSSLAARYPRHIDRSELWSAGALGLVEAARRYDPSTGIPFARYAKVRIRGAVIDSTRSRDFATRSLRRTLRGVAQATATFEETQGRTPTSPELAAALGISEAALAEQQAAAKTATLLHLDHPAGSQEDGTPYAEIVEERASEWLPEEAIEQRELVGTVRTAIDFLPPAQREVVDRYYFGGEVLRDIAESLGVTEARASQIRSEALTAMQSYFGTAFEGVPAIAPKAPGVRQRAAYVASMSASSTWRSRLDAADAERSGERGERQTGRVLAPLANAG